MKQRVMTVLMTAILLAALAGCGQQEELRETQRQLEQTQQQLEQLQQQLDETTAQQPSSEPSASQGEQTTRPWSQQSGRCAAREMGLWDKLY